MERRPRPRWSVAICWGVAIEATAIGFWEVFARRDVLIDVINEYLLVNRMSIRLWAWLFPVIAYLGKTVQAAAMLLRWLPEWALEPLRPKVSPSTAEVLLVLQKIVMATLAAYVLALWRTRRPEMFRSTVRWGTRVVLAFVGGCLILGFLGLLAELEPWIVGVGLTVAGAGFLFGKRLSQASAPGTFRRAIIRGVAITRASALAVLAALMGSLIAAGSVSLLSMARRAVGLPNRVATVVRPEPSQEKTLVVIVFFGDGRRQADIQRKILGMRRWRDSLADELGRETTENGGWWRREMGGMILGFDLPRDLTARKDAVRLPTGTVASESLSETLRFIQRVTGVQIIHSGKRCREVVMRREAGDGMFGSIPTDKPAFFSTQEPSEIAGFVRDLARFHGCESDATAKGIVVRDATDGEIREWVKAFIDNAASRAQPPRLASGLPRGAGRFLLDHLDHHDDRVVLAVLDALVDLREVEVCPALEARLVVWRDSRSKPLVRRLAETLVALGNANGLGELSATGRLSSLPRALSVHVDLGRSRRPEAVPLQRTLLDQFRVAKPLFLPWRLLLAKEVPATKEECRRIERLALQTIQAFLEPVWDEEATARFTVSRDGRRVRYVLTVSHWHGTLAGAWQDYEVHLERSGSDWLVVEAGRGMSMVS